MAADRQASGAPIISAAGAFLLSGLGCLSMRSLGPGYQPMQVMAGVVKVKAVWTGARSAAQPNSHVAQPTSHVPVTKMESIKHSSSARAEGACQNMAHAGHWLCMPGCG